MTTLSAISVFDRPSLPAVRRTTAGPAGADPQAAHRTAGILRVAPVYRCTAGTAVITVKREIAVAAYPHKIITILGDYFYGGTDQTDRSHIRLVPDAVAIFAVLFIEFFGSLPVKIMHPHSPYGTDNLLNQCRYNASTSAITNL
jgi:hypothetical protein